MIFHIVNLMLKLKSLYVFSELSVKIIYPHLLVVLENIIFYMLDIHVDNLTCANISSLYSYMLFANIISF